jgi:hypothetical protein
MPLSDVPEKLKRTNLFRLVILRTFHPKAIRCPVGGDSAFRRDSGTGQKRNDLLFTLAM